MTLSVTWFADFKTFPSAPNESILVVTRCSNSDVLRALQHQISVHMFGFCLHDIRDLTDGYKQELKEVAGDHVAAGILDSILVNNGVPSIVHLSDTGIVRLITYINTLMSDQNVSHLISR